MRNFLIEYWKLNMAIARFGLEYWWQSIIFGIILTIIYWLIGYVSYKISIKKLNRSLKEANLLLSQTELELKQFSKKDADFRKQLENSGFSKIEVHKLEEH